MSEDVLELSFLRAGYTLVKAEQELVPRLAEALGVPPQEVFSSWMDRGFPNVVLPPDEEWRLQVGQIQETEWRYFFHGMECDLANWRDGRYVRVEFGPHGRFDLLSSYAVLQFVMTSGPPWPEFPELKAHLAKEPPPYNEFSGCFQKADDLWKQLKARGFLEAADPALMALVERSTVRLPSGSLQFRLPDEFTDRQRLDCMVCERHVLSEAALRLLERNELC